MSSHRVFGQSDRAAHRAVALVFLCFGMVFATWVPRIPQIKHSLGLTDGELGTAMIGTPVGTLCAVRLASWGIARWGSGRMIRGGALLTAGALPLPALAWNLETLTAALLILGAALGLTEVAMNAQGVTLEQVIGRPVMSGLHGAYSIGGLLGALLGSGAAHLAVPLSTHLAVVSAGISVAAWFASGEALPDAEAPASPTRHGRNRWTGSVLLLGVIGLCSFVGEGTVENWSTVYLRDGLGAAAGVSGLGYAGCAGAMALVRLGGDRLVARFGPVTVVRAGSLVAVIGLTAVSAGVIAAIIGYTLFGAGVALIAPVAFSAAGKVPGIPSATAVSRVTGIAYLGFLGGPPLIGFTADLTGLGHAMLIPTALTVVITLLAKAVQPPSNRNGLS